MSAPGIPTIRSIICLSRARAPERIERDDIVEYQLDGTPIDERGRAPYLERFIHGAIYEQRPDVHSVVHNHSPSVIPFGVTGKKLKPLLHMCASIGHEVPIWDCMTSSATRRSLSPTWPWGAILPRRSDRARPR